MPSVSLPGNSSKGGTGTFSAPIVNPKASGIIVNHEKHKEPKCRDVLEKEEEEE